MTTPNPRIPTDPARLHPGDRDIEVIHATARYVIVSKPHGLRSVPGRGSDVDPALADSVHTRVLERFPEATGPMIVHRLDMETSGLLVVALDRETHRKLSSQFMNRKVGKTYEAVLDGSVSDAEGAIELPLIVDWPNRPRQEVNFERGKPARTLYRVLSRDDAASRTRVEFRPVTGRTHQLRVHASAPRALPDGQQGGLGCPILGDTLYGDPSSAARLMLHANRLAFWAPEDNEWRKFESPTPF